MAEQVSRLTFTLHVKGSSIIFWDNTLQYSTGSFNFAGTSLAEEIEGYGFPAYTIEEGSVYAAGDLYVKWTTNDGSCHELRVSLLSAKETSGGYAVSEVAFGDDPFGICGWFQPYPLTYKGWHVQDGIKEKISGTVSILATYNSKAPDYSGTIVDKCGQYGYSLKLTVARLELSLRNLPSRIGITEVLLIGNKHMSQQHKLSNFKLD